MNGRSIDLSKVLLFVLTAAYILLTWKTNVDVVESFERRRSGGGGRSRNSNNKLSWREEREEKEQPVPLLKDTTLVSQTNNNKDEKQETSVAAQDEHNNNNKDADNDNKTTPKFHIVFSTGCSIFQDWQSYTFFYFAKISGQPGEVTRVASGCNPHDAVALKQQFAEQIQIMSPHFHLHITPDFSRAADAQKPYKFFNKPLGLRHWMEHELGFPDAAAQDDQDAIFVILDPDQIILRNFVQDYTNEPEIYQPSPLDYTKIAPGQPMAAEYGFGAKWRSKIDISDILNSTSAPSPVRTWTDKDIMQHYAAGPPYQAVGSDMYNIVKTWADFVIPIWRQTKGTFLAEMFAYSTAAAHLNLPHRLTKSFMISDASSGVGEAWKFWIDDKSSNQVCALDFEPMPHVFHFCQRYYLGPYFFGKYKLPKDKNNKFFSCEHALIDEPPLDIADKYLSSVTPDGTEYKNMSPAQRIRMAFALCQLIPRMNQAATYFKQQHCPAGTANFEKSFHFPMDRPRGG